MQSKTKYSFHADNLDSSILITCPLTGIVSQIQMPALPIVLQFNHPLSHWHNAMQCLREIQKKKNHKEFSTQMIAGIILSLLREKDKLTNFPNSSATEANMLLQSAGIDSLWELCTTIAARWESENTWVRIPKLSFTLTVYDSVTTQSFGTIVSKYSRMIRNAITPENLDKGELGEIFLAFKENNKKLSKDKPNGIHIRSIASLKQETISKQNSNAKDLATKLKKDMPSLLAIMTTKAIGQLHLFGQEYRNDLAEKIRLCGIGKSNQDDFKQLAFFIENVESSFVEEDIIGFAEAVSPLPKSEKKIADVIAERLAKLAEERNAK